MLQTFVWSGGTLNIKLCTPPHHTNVWIFSTFRSYIFACLRRITFNFGKSTNFEGLFPVVSTGFLELVHARSWKKRRRVCSYCDSLVDVNKRDFGNHYLEWRKVWFKSQFFRIKHFRETRFKSSYFFFSKISTLLILCKLFLPRAQHLVFRYPTCIFVGIITDKSQFSLCALVSPYPCHFLNMRQWHRVKNTNYT